MEHSLKILPCETLLKQTWTGFHRREQHNSWKEDKGPYFSKVTNTGWALISRAPPGSSRASLKWCLWDIPSRSCFKNWESFSELHTETQCPAAPDKDCLHKYKQSFGIWKPNPSSFFFFPPSSLNVGIPYKKRRKNNCLEHACKCTPQGEVGAWFPQS